MEGRNFILTSDIPPNLLEGIEKTTNIIVQDRWFRSQDKNLGLSNTTLFYYVSENTVCHLDADNTKLVSSYVLRLLKRRKSKIFVWSSAAFVCKFRLEEEWIFRLNLEG